MDNSYVAVYEEGNLFPCGAMTLDMAVGLLPTLHDRTGINYYALSITSEEAEKIRRDIAISFPTKDASLN